MELKIIEVKNDIKRFENRINKLSKEGYYPLPETFKVTMCGTKYGETCYYYIIMRKSEINE